MTTKRINWKRLGTMLVLSALVLAGPVLPALAQGGDEAYCGGLSAADCQMLNDAAEATLSVESVAMPAWSVELEFSSGEETGYMAANGSGELALSPELVALLSDMPTTTTGLSPEAIELLLQQLNSETIQSMLAGVLFHLVIDDLTIESEGSTDSVSAEVIFKDMGLYLGTQAPNGAQAWFGEELELNAADLAEFDLSLEQALLALQTPEMTELMDQMEDLTAFQEELMALVDHATTTTRADDQTLHGQPMAVFVTEFDLFSFLSDPALATLIMDLIKSPTFAQLAEDSDMDLSEINEQQIQFALLAVGVVLRDTTLSGEQWVGLNDGYIHKISLYFEAQPSLAAFDPEAEDILITLSLEMELDRFNAVTPDAVDIPTEYASMDDSDDFLAGSPDQIKAQLEIGQTVVGELEGDEETEVIYGLVLRAGDTFRLVFADDETPDVSIYGPDGFLAAEYYSYQAGDMVYTAQEAGMYLVVLESYWDLPYQMTIEPVR